MGDSWEKMVEKKMGNLYNLKMEQKKTGIPFSIPFIDEEEIEEVINVLRGKWITTGEKVKEFEQAMKEYLHVQCAVAVSSGTAALEISLAAHDVGPGHDIITTAYTFASTALAIIHRGATPVLVDVKPDTFNIDPGKIATTIRDHYQMRRNQLVSLTTGNILKGLIVVHFAGQPAEMDEINEIAKKYGLFVIEDAAHAIGASYKGCKTGKSDNLVCFSFYSNKNLTTGEGGMIVTNDEKREEKLRLYSLHGISKSAIQRYKTGLPFYDIVCPGYKANLTDIQAALGVIQLKKLNGINQRRKEVAHWYTQELSGMEEISTLTIKRYNISSHHLYPVLLKRGLKSRREAIIIGLREKNIYPSVHFIPVHFHSFFKEYFKEKLLPDLSVAEDLFSREISLPIYPGLTPGDIRQVTSTLKDLIDSMK